MKIKLFIGICCGMLFSEILHGQVHWNFHSQKVSDDLFEIHLTATIDDGWHIYSQTQPPDAIAEPLQIQFQPNSAILLKGSVKEIGQRETKENREIGIKSYLYKSTVDFVQIIKLKSKSQTVLKGNIEFMACTSNQCLPPSSQPFLIQLQF